ncbi:coadhesin-like [Stylophora pistillata]|uniref:coadhesin-like n=1 Tax=Stylophora pistillata TaxID=50429 RepID=UPI000C054A19|nr:coadhesin-like [Stylophora pistillata]
MSPTEQRYAQIEKEALGITWASERFAQYLIVLKFHIETDHKPLVPLLGCKNLEDVPARIQRFKMRMMCFAYTISHVLVNGGYGKWSAFGECLVTSGGGVRERNRLCESPEPQFGGKTCEEQDLGPSVETEACNEQPCPVDGGYSDWTEFSECTVTCGGGVHQRTRDCNNPAPDNGGQNCERLGPAMESEQCNVKSCPTKAAENQGKASDEDDEKNKADKKEKRDAEESKKQQEDGIKENHEKNGDQEKDGNKDKPDKKNRKDSKEKSQ